MRRCLAALSQIRWYVLPLLYEYERLVESSIWKAEHIDGLAWPKNRRDTATMPSIIKTTLVAITLASST